MVTLLFLLLGQPPPVFQPAEDFYGAVGTRVTVEANAEPLAVNVNEAILFTLRIVGAKNPTEIKPPPLQQLPAFHSQFEIAFEKALMEDQTVVFRYTLRPRNANVKKIPRLRFIYHQPSAPEENAYPATYSESIAIAVREVIKEPALLTVNWPAAVPTRFPNTLTVYALLIFVFSGITIVYVKWWHKAHPQGAVLAKLKAEAIVRKALAALERSTKVAEVNATMRAYWHDRHGVPLQATNSEIDAALGKESAEFMGQCDAKRFGNTLANVTSLKNQATNLILQSEMRWNNIGLNSGLQ